MEADWAAEIGPRLDRIDAGWPGFIDLRRDPEAVVAVPETAGVAALGEVLALLNASNSPVFTCKCDVWTLASHELDPFEYDFPSAESRTGRASYIDLVARDSALFASFDLHEAWVRAAALRLRELPIPGGRADLVIRAALDGDAAGFGITLYAAGCGLDAASAQTAWEAILRATVTATMMEAAHIRASSSIG